MIKSISCFAYSRKDIEALAPLRVNDYGDLDDPLFGTDHITGMVCQKCDPPSSCLGHIGYIDLGVTIPNPLFLGHIKKIMSGICRKCYSYSAEKTKSCKLCRAPVSGETRDERLTEMLRVIKKGHPESLKYFTDFVIVPPKSMRPTDLDEARRTEISELYSELLREAKKSSKSMERMYDTYSSIVGASYISKGSESIMSSMSGKEGIIRGIMIGKRVNKCGRSVIVGDDDMRVDEVRIPKEMAEGILMPVNVTESNMREAKEMAYRGELNAPGKREKKIMPHEVRSGATFERSIRDGDWVMLNRQPSLSKNSVMGLKARVGKTKSLALAINTAVAPSYNADFDGDEMNIFLHTDEASVSEISGLMSVPQNVISPEDSKPVVRPVQDALTCTYVMTKKTSEVSREFYYDCCVACDVSPRSREKRKTSVDAISLAFPTWFSYTDDKIKIVEGEIVEGFADKETLCSGEKNIVQTICFSSSGSEALDFIHRLQKITNLWTQCYGLSLAFEDFDFKSKDRVTEIIKRGGNPDNIRNQIERLTKPEERGTLGEIVESGSKGSTMNLVQIGLMLGQQYVLGKELEGGFCRSSYYEGLDLEEYFSHQIAGREGVVRTNITTAEQGYLSRRIVKPMASIEISRNGSASSSTRVISTKFGESCLDPSKIFGDGSIIDENVITSMMSYSECMK